jgi:hypothetical protein
MKRRTALVAAAGFVAISMVAGHEIMTSSNQLCAAPAQPTISFAEDILPLLKWRCGSCHQSGGPGYEKSGLDLTSYEGVMKGTKFGPMVIPREPEMSNLMLLLDWRVKAEIRMPHGKKKLSTCDRNAIRTWIREGARNN